MKSMLGKIRFETYEKCYPSRLKKFFQSDINYNTYDKFIPKMKRAVVGNLPPELIRFFPEKTRANDIKEFQKSLSEISEYLRTNFYSCRFKPDYRKYDENYRPSKYVLDMAKSAENILNEKIRSGGGQFSAQLKFEDYGSFGNVYKLSIKDKNGNKIMRDKALKVYHALKEPLAEYKDSHNNYAEANFWTYLKRAAGHKLDKTEFTKHYISDMHGGYALSEFADIDMPKTTSPLNVCNLLHLYPPQDLQCNPKICGKIYDIGGYLKLGGFTGDKIVLRYFKKLFYRSEKELPKVMADMEALIQNPKTPHRNKIREALELYKKKVLSEQKKPLNNNIFD